MNNAKTIWIIIGAILLLLIGMIFFWPKNYNWYLTLNPSDNPYDLELFYDLLEENDKIEVVKLTDRFEKSLPEFDDENSNNLLNLDYGVFIDSTEIHHLLQFVENGNKAFFINQTPPALLLGALSLDKDSMNKVYRILYGSQYQEKVIQFDDYVEYDEEADSLVSYKEEFQDVFYNQFTPINLETADTTHLTYKGSDPNRMFYRSHDEKTDYFGYSYYGDWQLENTPFESLGLMDSVTNFIKIEYGDGAFYFHTTPLAFTNYHLTRKEDFNYVNAILTEFNEGNVLLDFIWHQNNYDNTFAGKNPYLPESPISFILSIPSLKWAWFLLLGGVVIFLIFRTKRNQRVIPVIPIVKNNSLEFSTTVGRLYFKEKNHKKIAQELSLYFYNHLRKRYHINTKVFDEDAKRKFLKIFPQEKRRINILHHMGKKCFSKDTLITEEELHELFQITRYFILKS